jgi:hypothetical protein
MASSMMGTDMERRDLHSGLKSRFHLSKREWILAVIRLRSSEFFGRAQLQGGPGAAGDGEDEEEDDDDEIDAAVVHDDEGDGDGDGDGDSDAKFLDNTFDAKGENEKLSPSPQLLVSTISTRFRDFSGCSFTAFSTAASTSFSSHLRRSPLSARQSTIWFGGCSNNKLIFPSFVQD